MEKLDLKNKLTRIFQATFNDDSLELTEQLTANDVDNWDSLTHMILISDIEQEFDIKFKLKDLNKMKNVGALIEILSSKIN